MSWQTNRSWVYSVFFDEQIEYDEESFLYQKLNNLGRMLGGELNAISIDEDGRNRFKFEDPLPPVPNISGCEYLCLIRDDVGWPGGPSETCSVLGCHMDTKSWDLEEKLHPGKREK